MHPSVRTLVFHSPQLSTTSKKSTLLMMNHGQVRTLKTLTSLFLTYVLALYSYSLLLIWTYYYLFSSVCINIIYIATLKNNLPVEHETWPTTWPLDWQVVSDNSKYREEVTKWQQYPTNSWLYQVFWTLNTTLLAFALLTITFSLIRWLYPWFSMLSIEL